MSYASLVSTNDHSGITGGGAGLAKQSYQAGEDIEEGGKKEGKKAKEEREEGKEGEIKGGES